MLARERWRPVCQKSRRLSGAVGFWRPKLPAALGDRHTADDRAAEAAMARRHHPSGMLDRESAGYCQSPSLLAALLDTGVKMGLLCGDCHSQMSLQPAGPFPAFFAQCCSSACKVQWGVSSLPARIPCCSLPYPPLGCGTSTGVWTHEFTWRLRGPY